AGAVPLAYDVPYRARWDWRVSLYAWPKGISAGLYLVALVLVGLGAIAPSGPLWRWAVPLGALGCLVLTCLLLLSDLEHPGRFYLLFTRPQARSWLVRGAFILAGYGLLLALHLALA